MSEKKMMENSAAPDMVIKGYAFTKYEGNINDDKHHIVD